MLTNQMCRKNEIEIARINNKSQSPAPKIDKKYATLWKRTIYIKNVLGIYIR
jgi:hypothetical protein